MTLRELRLWHFRQALALHACAERHEQYCKDVAGPAFGKPPAVTHARSQARAARRKAVLHESAVDALNTVVAGDVADDLAACAATSPSPSEDSSHVAIHSAQPA